MSNLTFDQIKAKIARIDAKAERMKGRLMDNALLKRVADLELSVRVTNLLKNCNITYIGDLIQKTESDMLRVPNFSRKSLNEIKEVLAQMGLSLNRGPPAVRESCAFQDRVKPWMSECFADEAYAKGRLAGIEEAAKVADDYEQSADGKFDGVIKASRKGEKKLELAGAASAGMSHTARRIAAAIRARGK